MTIPFCLCLITAACTSNDPEVSPAVVRATVSASLLETPSSPTAEPGITLARVQMPTPTVVAVEVPTSTVLAVEDRQTPDSLEVAQANNRRFTLVRRDDLVTSIAFDAKVVFPNTKRVAFRTDGILERLVIAEGETVTPGQPLAYMDQSTLIALEEAFAQAQLDALMAKEALDNALSPRSPLEIAQAEVKVADARASLRASENALISMLMPDDHEIATAESVRADTILKIDVLRREIDTLVRGPDQAELGHLQNHANSDQVILENALRSESLTEEEWEIKLGRASGEVERAAEDYKAVFVMWLGVDAQHVDISLPPEALLLELGADLQSLYGRSDVDLREAPPAPDDDPSTLWNEQTIWAYTYRVPFEVRPGCDSSSAAPGVYCLSDEMTKSWNRLFEFQKNLNNLNTRAAIAVTTAHNAVDEARDAVVANAERLADISAPPDPLLLQSKDKELALAEASLAEVESLLSGLHERRELGHILGLPASAPEVGEMIDAAVLDGVSEPLRRELMAAENEIQDAVLSLREADESLEALIEPADPALVELRKANLATAEIEVELASQRLTDAILVSPISGIVTEIHTEAGDFVDRGALAMTVVDPTTVEVHGAVDETAVLDIRVGAPTNVHLRVQADRTLHGTISHVSPEATRRAGAVTYEVRIGIEPPHGIELRSGLTAVAEAGLGTESNVLLILRQALRGSIEKPTVLALVDGVLVEKSIVTGSSNGTWIVVESGLREGDIVAID